MMTGHPTYPSRITKPHGDDGQLAGIIKKVLIDTHPGHIVTDPRSGRQKVFPDACTRRPGFLTKCARLDETAQPAAHPVTNVSAELASTYVR